MRPRNAPLNDPTAKRAVGIYFACACCSRSSWGKVCREIRRFDERRESLFYFFLFINFIRRVDTQSSDRQMDRGTSRHALRALKSRRVAEHVEDAPRQRREANQIGTGGFCKYSIVLLDRGNPLVSPQPHPFPKPFSLFNKTFSDAPGQTAP